MPPKPNNHAQADAFAEAMRRFIARKTGAKPVVYVRKARCPGCNAVAQGKPVRSEQAGNGSLQRRKCKVCQLTFFVVVE